MQLLSIKFILISYYWTKGECRIVIRPRSGEAGAERAEEMEGGGFFHPALTVTFSRILLTVLSTLEVRLVRASDFRP